MVSFSSVNHDNVQLIEVMRFLLRRRNMIIAVR